eukprot:4064975-Pleurochrysis_carterae.AAC.1
MQPQTEAALEAELVQMAARAKEESGSWRLLVRKSTLVAVCVGIVLACLQARSMDAFKRNTNRHAQTEPVRSFRSSCVPCDC